MNPLIRLVKLYELIAKLHDDEVIIMLAYGQQLLESRPKVPQSEGGDRSL